MLTFYLCFLAGGIVLPVLNFIMGFLSGGLDTEVDADIDLDTDISTGTVLPEINPHTGIDSDSIFSISLIPTSLLSLSALAITFGAVGALRTIGNKNWLLTLVLASFFGYVASVIIQTIIKSLKKVQTRSNGINENELLLYDGKIVDTILPGQLGTVSFVTLKDVRVSYPAKCEDCNLKIEAGRTVKVKEIQNGVFIVEPKNRYES